jgi:hypothetical protein
MAQVSHSIPFRTRSLKPVAPMVLCLKARESRSLPGLPATCVLILTFLLIHHHTERFSDCRWCVFMVLGAGWSSPVARQAHNLKVVGSNPTPATKLQKSVI